jgi:hypothetical protein
MESKPSETLSRRHHLRLKMTTVARNAVIGKWLATRSDFGTEPRSLLLRIFFLLLLTTIWVFILPGIVAWADGVFFDDQVSKRMKEPAFSVNQEYKQRRLDLQEVQTGLLIKLKDYARGNGSAEQIRSLTDSIEGTEDSLTSGLTLELPPGMIAHSKNAVTPFSANLTRGAFSDSRDTEGPFQNNS